MVQRHLWAYLVFLPQVVGFCKDPTFSEVESKPGLTGHSLGEFSITYKAVKPSWPHIQATRYSCFVACRPIKA